MLTVTENAPHMHTYAGSAPLQERMELLNRLANTAGLRLPATMLPVGTALISYGEERLRALGAEIAALPDALDAFAALNTHIGLTAPVDREVRAGSLYMMHSDGTLKRKDVDGPGLAYTDTGFHHVSSFLKPGTVRNGFAENMLALPPDLRAQVFNHWTGLSRRQEPLVIRTARRVVDGVAADRFVRAVTSAKHSLEHGDDRAVVSTLLLDADAFRGAKARITRDADRSEFEVIWPMMGREIVVGDVVKGGVRITNSETKAGALRVEAFLLRVLCKNFTTAYTQDMNEEEITIRHVGDLRTKLPRALKAALARVDPFVKAFGEAYAKALPVASRAESLAFVGRKYELPERVLNSAAQLWDVDGVKSAGDTLAGLVNALTRASQSEGATVAADVERAAGRLVVGR